MNSISKSKGISKLKNNTSKLKRQFSYDLSSGVRYYRNQRGHLEHNKYVSQLLEIQTRLDELIQSIDMTKNEIQEITNLKQAFNLYSRILNDPNTDFDNRKQELMEKLNNIDWETIIRFFKTNISNPEYKKTIDLIYQFLQQLQIGEIISQVSGNDVEIELANKLIGISQRILKCHIEQSRKKATKRIKTARGRIKKPRKPRKPTLGKKKRKKKSTIKN